MNTLHLPVCAALVSILAASSALGQEPSPPDLVIDVSGSEPVVAVGGTVTYRVTVTNQGGVPAHDLQLYCGLPTGQMRRVDEAGPSPSQRVGETEDAEEYLFRQAVLQPGARAEWSLSVQALAEGDAWARGVAIAAGMDSPVEAWDTTRVVSQPMAAGPLVLEVAVTPEVVGVGDAVTCRITVTNQSSQTMTQAIVRCILPEELSFVPPEGAEDVEMAGPNQVLYRHPVLNPAERASFTLVARAERSGQARLALWLNADGLARPEQTSVDLVVEDRGHPGGSGPVRLALAQVDPQPEPGSVLRLDLTVTNDDPRPREGLEVLCRVDPRLLGLEDATGPSEVQAAGDGAVYIAVPALTGSATWRLTTRVLGPGVAETAARLRGPSLPEVATSLTSVVGAGPSPDDSYVIRVTEDVDPITVDDSVTYMVDVQNLGDAPMVSLQIRCKFDPERVAYLSDYGPSAGEVGDQGEVRFTAPELGPGERLTWSVTARAFSTGEGWMQAELFTSRGHEGTAIQTTRIQP